MDKVDNINVTAVQTLPTAKELIAKHPRSPEQSEFIYQSRKTIEKIIQGEDERLLVVVGPCSIHDTEAGLDYARKLKALFEEVSDRLYLVMRTYFEKPRTAIGWKGLIIDPHLDGTCDIPEGLKLARKFLWEIASMNLPAATEFLDPITPQYISDLISWAAIGARTTESQTHRQLASALSMPVGFKNGIDGCLSSAINAIKAARCTQSFLGINQQSVASSITTRGNANTHLVLRGGKAGPNYKAEEVKQAMKVLKENGINPLVMVDCSHENSGKDPDKQVDVFNEVIEQVKEKDSPIMGVMLESNLQGGKQMFPQAVETLEYGRSITDACLDWESTRTSLCYAGQA